MIQQAGEREGSQGEKITDGDGEAAKQANSIERTTEERGEIRASLQEEKTRPYEEESRECEAYRFFVTYKSRKGKK